MGEPSLREQIARIVQSGFLKRWTWEQMADEILPLRDEELERAATALRAAEARVATLEGQVLAANELIAAIGRHARSDGQRTFDDCIRDLAWIDDQCRAVALAKLEGETP